MDPKDLAGQFSRVPQRNRRWVVALLGAMVLILFLSFKSILMILDIQDEQTSAEPQVLELNQTGANVAPLTFTVELKDVAVHVMSEDGKSMAYAQFSLILDCPSKEAVQKIEEGRSVILNQIFDTANNYTLERLSTTEGKEAFKAELVQQLNQSLGDSSPRSILIQSWIMG